MYEFTLTKENCQKVLYHIWWLRQFNIPYKVNRADNTQYIVSLSYGKDSIATIEACKQLGLPLDGCIHAEVWATDTIPADLPPMVEFKGKADKIIKERYGLDVHHVCAMKKVQPSQIVNVERERESRLAEAEKQKASVTHRSELMSQSFTTNYQEENSSEQSKDFPNSKEVGVNISKKMPSMQYRKLTYESLFYKTYTPKAKLSKFTKNSGGGDSYLRLPKTELLILPRQAQGEHSRQEYTASLTQPSRAVGATNSNQRICGFPISIHKGNWCTALKTTLFGKARQHSEREYKYCAVSRNCL